MPQSNQPKRPSLFADPCYTKLETVIDLVAFFKQIDANTSTILQALAVSILGENLTDYDDLKAATIREAAATVKKIEDQEDNEHIEIDV